VIEQTARPDSATARWVIGLLTALVLLAVLLLMSFAARPPGAHVPSALATLNATLNAACAVCLLTGFMLVKRRRLAAHRVCMLIAFSFSSLFLITYVLHHLQVGSVPFRGEGAWRGIYFAILIPHIVLAAPIVPLALFTLYRGWTGRLVQHKRIARWTLPLWLYVSVSGVLVYAMLYHL